MGSGSESEKSLTVVGGHPRSGTSSLRRILNRHPDVYCSNELPLREVYPAFIQSLRVAGERAAESEWNPNFRQRIDRLVAESWFALSKFDEEREPFEAAAAIANKTPGSERYFSDYARLLPEARFIYCYRDPVKVVRSNLNMPWSGGSLDFALDRLRSGYSNFLDFQGRFPTRLHVFKIEDYARDPHAVSGKLCEILGVSDGRAGIEKMAETKPANTLGRYESKGQAKGRELTEDEEGRVRSDAMVKRVAAACGLSEPATH